MLKILDSKLSEQQQIFDEQIKQASNTILGNLNWHIIKFEQMRNYIDTKLNSNINKATNLEGLDSKISEKMKNIKIHEMPQL